MANDRGAERFRAGVEAGDVETALGALAENVVLHSPVTFKPFEGRAAVAHVLRTVFEVFEDFRYTDQLEDRDAAALIFNARVGDRKLDGLDLLRFDGDGKVRELSVMVRPMSGLNALAEAMGREFERLGITPPGV